MFNKRDRQADVDTDYSASAVTLFYILTNFIVFFYFFNVQGLIKNMYSSFYLPLSLNSLYSIKEWSIQGTSSSSNFSCLTSHYSFTSELYSFHPFLMYYIHTFIFYSSLYPFIIFAKVIKGIAKLPWTDLTKAGGTKWLSVYDTRDMPLNYS